MLNDYILEKYKTKMEKLSIWISIIWILCTLIATILTVLACMHDEKILTQLGALILIMGFFISLLVEIITIKNLEKRNNQEIEDFESKFPIGKRVPILLNWSKLDKEYDSLSDEAKRICFNSIFAERPKEIYLTRYKEIQGNIITSEYKEGQNYVVYNRMMIDYNQMIEIIKSFL